MKLKRFLLRYEPPGVGLEVEENGEIEVRHKDLPLSGEVKNRQDISSEIDKLIDSEPDLLSKRRHHRALVQLLGRLYQIQVDDEAEIDPAVGKASPKETNNADPYAEGSFLEEGQSVCMIGLKGKQQIHNGELGTLTRIKGDKGKYEVLLTPSRGSTEQPETIKVKGAEHLVPVAPKDLSVGTHVAIRGLRNHIELNGCLGRVVECHEETHRFEVRATESGQLFRVKQENLVPIESCPQVQAALANAKENREPNANTTPRLNKKEGSGAASEAKLGADAATAISSPGAGAAGDEDTFEAGSVVQLAGLKTAMVYNGQTAEVLSVDKSRGRYEIRLGDGSVKTIRAENVRLVSQPSKASPRTRRAKEVPAKPPGGK